jgi:hypothetical protein
MIESKRKSSWGRRELIVLACMIGFFVWVSARISSLKEPSISPAYACISNLRQIEAAKEEWAQEKGITNGAIIVSENDITPYIPLDSRGTIPKCPSGGTYTIGRLNELPTCSLGTNVTPSHVLQ